MRTALIYGVTGQDGSYLTENLLNHGYRVIGVKRRTSGDNTARLKYLIGHQYFTLEEGDVCDSSYIFSSLLKYEPWLVFNLAAQSHVGTSFEQPIWTTNATYLGALNILEAIRLSRQDIRFYQASSSEMFGKSVGPTGFQDEDTPFLPQSPYAIAKLASHHAVRLYREAYGIFACSGILFNHESERRGDNFVTKKITNWIKDFNEWKENLNEKNLTFAFNLPNNMISSVRNSGYIFGPKFPKLKLGNINSSRDWGHAEDYVEAMRLMLEHNVPDDYVIATGETYTVEDFLKETFSQVGISNYMDFIEIDESLKRPAEVSFLRGDASKARRVLGWAPKILFKDLVKRMICLQ